MKKILVFISIFFIAATLSACNNDQDNNGIKALRVKCLFTVITIDYLLLIGISLFIEYMILFLSLSKDLMPLEVLIMVLILLLTDSIGHLRFFMIIH